jgi:sugar phosphate isomerase/epimerase
MQLFVDAIDLAADLGVTYVVIVPGRLNPLFAPPRDLREGWMRESLDPLVAHAERRGVKLTLENIPIACFPDAGSLGNFVRSYRSDVLSVCYDAANAHFIGESPAAGLRELGDLVSLVHLSDTTMKIWRHDEVGLGDVPFDNVLEGIRDIGFKGTCMMEIISTDDPLNAMLRSRSALAALGYHMTEEVSS